MTIRYAIIGQKAASSGDFVLDDLPGTAGRLDVLVRCIRAALLSSHGMRTDVVVYLVLLGGTNAPRVMRIEGARAAFIRPDERSLAVLAKKVLSAAPASSPPSAAANDGELVEYRRGIGTMNGSIDAVLRDASAAASSPLTTFLLEEGATDIRSVGADAGLNDAEANLLFVVGDHLGIPDDILSTLNAVGARRISIGPVSVHADDVVAIVQNEIDRRRTGSAGTTKTAGANAPTADAPTGDAAGVAGVAGADASPTGDASGVAGADASPTSDAPGVAGAS